MPDIDDIFRSIYAAPRILAAIEAMDEDGEEIDEIAPYQREIALLLAPLGI